MKQLEKAIRLVQIACVLMAFVLIVDVARLVMALT